MQVRMFAAIALAAAAFAQAPAPGQRGTPPQPTELKTYLSLTDQQVTALQSLRTQQAQALRAVFEQIRSKQTALEEALKTPGANPTTVGQLLLDIQSLRQQITQAREQLQSQAVALLTVEQKTKLQALAEAQRLQPAVRQAESLSLLTPAEGFGAGRGPGFHGFAPGSFGGPALMGQGRRMMIGPR